MAKRGKYDGVIDGLQRQAPTDPPYQDRVNKVKEEFDKLDPVDLAKQYIELRKGSGISAFQIVQRLLESQREAEGTADAFELRWTPEREALLLVECLGEDGIAALEKLCNLRKEACVQLLVASQERGDEAWGKYGVKDNAMRLEGGETIRVQSEPYGQVKDKEAFRLWCIDNGYEKSLQLWPATMNAIAKERCVNGEPNPDGVEVFRKDIVKYVAPGGGDE